ncbi:hypothetical protein FW320_13095 [Azospirillum sp. Vi22]|uniref:hypothetical protein n=1 Tax=Azospirillum baldaniorum TaxID=1064539 RepID=UPI00157B2F8C|nr:hypothetical protein [Azospirillum baldaniorum]NUB07107.1 hypothetical protein [Azospirillum baldaniorum]
MPAPRLPVLRKEARKPVARERRTLSFRWPSRELLAGEKARAARSYAWLTGTLSAAAGLTIAAGQVGLDQQAAAAILLFAVAPLAQRAFPQGDGPPLPSTERTAPAAPSAASSTSVMPARDVVILETGRQVRTSDLPRHMGYENPDFDLAGYAVRNRGAIQLRARTIRLRPDGASSAAIEVACGIVANMEDGPVTLSTFTDGAWRFASYGSPMAAIDGLLDLTGAHMSSMFEAVSEGMHAAEGHMRAAFQTWRDSAGELNVGSIDRLRETGAWSRAVALCPAGGQGTGFAFVHIGDGITAFGERWRHEMIGKVDDGQPDPDYAAFVSELYRRSIEGEMPAVNRISASLRLDRRAAPSRLRYRQLLLPWTVRDGAKRRTIITSVTQRHAVGFHHAVAGTA